MKQYVEGRDATKGEKSYLYNSYSSQLHEEDDQLKSLLRKSGENIQYEPYKEGKYRFTDHKHKEFHPREFMKSYASQYRRPPGEILPYKKTIYDLYKSNSKTSKNEMSSYIS